MEEQVMKQVVEEVAKKPHMSKTQWYANELRNQHKDWSYGAWNVYNTSNGQIIRRFHVKQKSLKGGKFRK